MNYNFESIRKIAETFDEHEVKYCVSSDSEQEEVDAGISVSGVPAIMTRFIRNENFSHVAFRVFGLACDVPPKKRERVNDVCNDLNAASSF